MAKGGRGSAQLDEPLRARARRGTPGARGGQWGRAAGSEENSRRRAASGIRVCSSAAGSPRSRRESNVQRVYMGRLIAVCLLSTHLVFLKVSLTGRVSLVLLAQLQDGRSWSRAAQAYWE